MKWFRLYSEFATDPKLKTFPKAQRYDLICLLCMANEAKERGVIELDAEDIAATLDMQEADYAAFIAKLERKSVLTTREDGALVFTNWLARQYDKPSDRPAETAARKAKQREENAPKGVTLPPDDGQSRESHAEVTRSHATYSDSDTEAEDTENTPPSEGDAPAKGQTGKAPKAKPMNAAVMAFHTRRIEHMGKAPSRKDDEEKRAGDLWAEHGEEYFRRAMDGYFTCLNGSDDWPKRQGFTFIAFLRQFDKWEAGQPPSLAPSRASPNGHRPPALTTPAAQVNSMAAQLEQMRRRP